MTSKLAREKAAHAWCTPETEKIVLDPKLANAFADILDDIWSKPWLGNATTGELIKEIESRVDLKYKTVEDKVCPDCGYRNMDHDKTCHQCGRNLEMIRNDTVSK